MATNWKKKYEEAAAALWDMTETAKIFEQAATSWRGKYSALKGQLTRCKKKLVAEQAKNAEVKELADLTGLRVDVFQESDCSWWFDTGEHADLMYISYVIDRAGVWVKFKTAIKINRPVSYTGRWQDSKVTATPNHIADSRKKAGE
jgi:hypothetical protein